MRNAKNNDLKNINNRSKNNNSKNKKTGNDFDERKAGPEQPDSYMGNDRQWILRALVLAFVDICSIAISFFFALMIRFEFVYSHIPELYLDGYLKIVPIYIVISLVVFYFCRLYHSIWRFASINELIHILSLCHMHSGLSVLC